MKIVKRLSRSARRKLKKQPSNQVLGNDNNQTWVSNPVPIEDSPERELFNYTSSYLTNKEKHALYENYRSKVKTIKLNSPPQEASESKNDHSLNLNRPSEASENKNDDTSNRDHQNKPKSETTQLKNRDKPFGERKQVTDTIYCTGITNVTSQSLKPGRCVGVFNTSKRKDSSLSESDETLLKKQKTTHQETVDCPVSGTQTERKEETGTVHLERNETFGIEWERKEQRQQFRNSSARKPPETVSKPDTNLTETITNVTVTVPDDNWKRNDGGTISNVSQPEPYDNNTKTNQPIPSPSNPRSNSEEMKMVIIPFDYPRTMLTSEQIAILREYLYSELNRGDRRRVRIRNCHPVKGSLSVVCVGEFSCEWLKSVVDRCFIWRWLNLTVKEYDELHGTVRMGCTVPNNTGDNYEILQKISRQNYVDTQQWKIISKREQYNCNALQLVVIVDRLSYNKLKDLNFRLKYDYNTILFQIKNKS